jgi:hypothetical protein
MKAAKVQSAFSDSWSEMTASAKARTHFFFIYGQSQNKMTSPAVKAMDQMQIYMKSIGFQSSILKVRQGAATWENASLIRNGLLENLDGIDSAILVPISKGSQEVVHFFIDYLPQMNSRDAKKIKLVLSLSGVIRNSYLSKWIMTTPPSGPTRLLMKAGIFLKGGEDRANLIKGSGASLATDPWIKKLSSTKNLNHVKWVNFAMLPEKPDGTQKYSMIEQIWPWILNANAKIGPQDGATETATSILPPDTGFEQHIIRAYGPHNLVPGRYMNGELIAPSFYEGPCLKRAAMGGEEFMKSVARAFHQSLLE